MNASPAIKQIIVRVNTIVNLCGENITVGKVKIDIMRKKAAQANAIKAFG